MLWSLPARSAPFKRVFGLPSGGFSRICKNAWDPVVAARCNGNCDALSLALIYMYTLAHIAKTSIKRRRRVL